MTVRKADNTVLSKSTLIAAATDVTPAAETQYEIPYDVYQDYKTDPKDGGGFESEKRKVFYEGQVVTAGEIDAVYPGATVTAISPATGSTSVGTDVTITGTNLSPGATVTFGGTTATNIEVVDGETITCTTPVKTAGAVTVVVGDDAGSVTKTNFFTYA